MTVMVAFFLGIVQVFIWTHDDLYLSSKVIKKHSSTLSLLQRKTWLREALGDICRGQVDEVEQMKRCLAVLRQEGMSGREREGEEERDDEDEDERESAFEMLSELCENLDNARGL